MHTFNADTAWAAVTAADPALLDRDGLASLLASIERVRAVCAAVEVVAVRIQQISFKDCHSSRGTEMHGVDVITDVIKRSNLGAGRQMNNFGSPHVDAGVEPSLQHSPLTIRAELH